MSTLSIGMSALQVNQRLLDMTGQNIANANTPNYHRQVADLAARITGSSVGTGVEIRNITRVVDRLLEEAVVRNTASASNASTRAEGLAQLESLLAPGEGSLHETLGRFFDEAERLSTQPESLAQRRVVLATAGALAERFNALADNLNRMRSDLGNVAQSTVNEVNALTREIARLNTQIHDGTAVGQATNGLLDQRDGVIARLAELVDVRVVPQESGQINLYAGGVPIILNSSASPLVLSSNSQNQLFVHLPGSREAIGFTGGSLAGTLDLLNNVLPSVRAQFDEFARALVTEVDAIHATGLGLDGPMTSLLGERQANKPSLPLEYAGLSLPVKAGELYITVTELATGQRSLHRVNIDPATQTLSSLASAISAIPNVQAVVDAQVGTLNLLARPGFAFDFTGNLSSKPDTQSISGTAVAAAGGRYTGTANDLFDFRVVGSGTVGASANLALEVRNGAGTLISTLNIGQGYEAGTDLPGVHGVKIRLTTGTLNNGDAFQFNVAADPDSAGILTALGLNTFFVGSDAGGLAVRADLAANPERFALSLSGEPGDGSNLTKLVALRTQNTMNDGSLSFRQFLDNLIANVGGQVQDAGNRRSALDSLGIQLEAQRQSVSGVDPNEELIRLVQYQRSYQMSARFVSVVNETLDELFRLA